MASRSVNKVILIGHLGRDAETKFTPNGVAVTRFSVATNRRWKDQQTGEWKDAVSYRPGDVTALILALEKAREYCLTTPLAGEQSEDDRMTGLESPDELA